MKRKNLAVCLSLALTAQVFMFGAAFAQNGVDTIDLSGYKKVPVVKYTSYSFRDAVIDAFRFTETQPYHLISGNQVYSYGINGARESIKGRSQSREIKLNRKPVHIEKFVDIIAENDSCFFMSFTEIDLYNNRILGVIENGDMAFYNTEGKRFDRLDSLAMDAFRSAENIYDVYDRLLEIDATKLIFYNSDFNKPYTTEEAVAILQDDYMFRYYYDPTDVDAAISNFIGAVSRHVELSDEEKLRLEQKLRLASAAPDTDKPRLGSIKTMQSDFDIIPFMTLNVSNILKDVLSGEKYRMVRRRMAIDRSTSYFAYRFLSKTMRDNMHRFYFGESGEEVVVAAYGRPEPEVKYFLNEVIF